MASPTGYTRLGSADFYRFAAGVVPSQHGIVLGPGDINYNTGTAGQTANEKFINLWNSGGFTVLVSGTGGPGDGIQRLGTYRLLATAYIEIRYGPPPPDPTPLTSTPPIELTSIQNAFGAFSLDNARAIAGFGSPIGMLDFLGATPPTFPTIERQVVDPSGISGFSWSQVGSYASTDFGDSSVTPVGFGFGPGSPGDYRGGSVIPTNSVIYSITIRVFNGGQVGATSQTLLAAADFWLEDPNFTSFLE